MITVQSDNVLNVKYRFAELSEINLAQMGVMDEYKIKVSTLMSKESPRFI